MKLNQIFVWICFASIISCGYKLIEKRTILPGGTRKVAISPIENRTKEPALGQILTQELIQTLKTQTQIELCPPEKTSVVISGVVVDVSERAIGYDQFGRANLVEIRISAKLWLLEKSTQKMLWQSGILVEREQYPLGDDFFINYQLKRQAFEQICKRLAQTGIELLFSDF